MYYNQHFAILDLMPTSTNPTVSIIMPVYNCARYLRESIDSVLRQTYTDFELIIVNDGSTDSTQEIIDYYAPIDTRIVPIIQKNIGLVATLNKAIGMARGKYIARIDGDDPWFDDKLHRQMALFEKDDSLVLVGGSFEIIDENGFFIETILPLTRDEDLRRTLTLRNAFGHAGVVFLKEAVQVAGLYSDKFGPTEDYELWIRLSKIGRLASVPDPVFRYRILSTGISQSSSEKQAIESKSHSHRQWLEEMPRVFSRTEILTQSRRYFNQSTGQWRGVAMKEQFLSDNAQIGIKLIRYGKYIEGLMQLWNVASTGRAGTKSVFKRFTKLDKGSFKQ